MKHKMQYDQYEIHFTSILQQKHGILAYRKKLIIGEWLNIYETKNDAEKNIINFFFNLKPQSLIKNSVH